MINKKKKYIGRLTLATAITSILFSGCGAAQKELAQTDRAFYEKISYQTVTVQSGSLTPQTTISLSAQGYTRFSYGATNTELTLEKVNVAVGDHVKKGDILVAFKSGEIQKKIEDYSGQISQNKLLAEHYRAIMKIDDTQDYSSDIAQLDKDTEVAQLYLDEAKEKLSRYQITASEDGTITAMNNSLLAGVFEPVSDMSAVSDAQIFSMEVTRPAIENAVYVQKDAVHEKDGRYFVYTLDENGYRQAVWISVADQVGDYRIITEGLKSGDEVVLQ